MSKLTTVFAGSPRFAATILANLAHSKYAPQAVFTQPDRPKGRGQKVVANPVKQLAQNLGLPIEQPASLRREDALASLAHYKPDVFIVAAYGLILPEQILRLPRFGCINVHASLLPRWRGAAPIERAIMAGDTETGVCIMQMERGLDTGPVHAQVRVPIDIHRGAAALEHNLAEIGSTALLEVLKTLKRAAGDPSAVPPPTPQNDDFATYAEKLDRADRQLNWHLPAENLARQIIAMADRLPVRATVNECGVQFLAAHCIQQTLVHEDQIVPGTIVDVSKAGILVQCATDLLQISSLKVERGKGSILDPSSIMNGFRDLFYPGVRIVS